MTEVIFETASLADVIGKASRVAPGKVGVAFDKAWGIVLDIYPDEEIKCVVRATNLDVFYTESVTCEHASGPKARWRLPAQFLSNLISKLPIGIGKSVKFTQNKNRVVITCGRMKATLALGDSAEYPHWDSFEEEMTTVSNLGHTLSLVEWAASAQNDPPWCGVHLNGEYAIATDRYKVVRVPCPIELKEPITIPAGVLRGVIRAMGDTEVSTDGNMLLLQPDDSTQIRTVIYEADFVNIDPITKIDLPNKIEINKDEALALLERVNQYAGADRMPIIKLFLGKGELAAYMSNDEVGFVGDVLILSGQCPHERFEVKFTPKNIMDALAKCPSQRLTLYYDPSNPMQVVRISDEDAYDAWVKPRKELTPSN